MLLTGCPQPDDAGTTGGPGGPAGGVPGGGGPPPGADGAGGPPADGTVPPADGTAPPVDGMAPPVDGAPVGGEAAGGGPPMGDAGAGGPGQQQHSFDTIIAGGATVTISGTITGSATAQVDFTVAKTVDGHKMAEVLHVAQAADGKFSVKAPAKYADAIYVSAGVDLTGDGPTKDALGGAADAPITLAGKDVSVAITVSKSADWNKKMPWYSAMSDSQAPGSAPAGAPPDEAAAKAPMPPPGGVSKPDAGVAPK